MPQLKLLRARKRDFRPELQRRRLQRLASLRKQELMSLCGHSQKPTIWILHCVRTSLTFSRAQRVQQLPLLGGSLQGRRHMWNQLEAVQAVQPLALMQSQPLPRRLNPLAHLVRTVASHAGLDVPGLKRQHPSFYRTLLRVVAQGLQAAVRSLERMLPRRVLSARIRKFCHLVLDIPWKDAHAV